MAGKENPLYKVYIKAFTGIKEQNSQSSPTDDEASKATPRNEVVAEIPEGTALNIEQEYENPYRIEISPALKGAFEYLYPLATKAFTGREQRKSLVWDHNLLYVWLGGSPLQLSLDIEFVAYDSIQNDIITPFKTLLKLSLPYASGKQSGIAKASLSPPPRISFRIGNILTIEQCILTQVSPQIERPFVSDDRHSGIPMKLPVSITIQTTNIMTQNRVDQYFFKR